MKIEEIEQENFGRCVRITNGIIDCVVTVEFGPRIIRFGFLNDENIFYSDADRKYVFREEDIPLAGGKNSAFYLYGGHRLELCRKPRKVFPDNSPVVYAVMNDSVSFTPPRPKQSEFQSSFEVMMGKTASDIMVVHTAKNCSKETAVLGLRPSTMMRAGGMTVIPQNRQGQHGLPCRTVTFWPDTDITDRRIFYSNRFLAVRQEPGNETPLRLGTNNLPGWIAYAGKGFTLFKRFVANSQAAYPDYGSSCEVRLTGDFSEISTLSPLFEVEPEETVKHVENLSLYHSEGIPVFSGESEIEKWAGQYLV